MLGDSATTLEPDPYDQRHQPAGCAAMPSKFSYHEPPREKGSPAAGAATGTRKGFGLKAQQGRVLAFPLA